jgi:hypothetical protein
MKEDGYLLYFYINKNGRGSWRTTNKNGKSSADPNSKSLGSGL